MVLATRGWKVGERENGKPIAWIAIAGPLTLLLRWHVVDAASGRQWWILLMLPSPYPFSGYVSGSDANPELPAFDPKLGWHQVSEAQKAAMTLAADWLRPHAEAYAALMNSIED
jgi:hypothetical protein